MTKYMLKEPYYVGDTMSMPGDMFEIKKLKHPIKLDKGPTFNYIIPEEEALLSKKSLKTKFTKGTYKSETPIRVLKTLLILFLYELSKYVTNQILIKFTANDAVDKVPMDYEISKWR